MKADDKTNPALLIDPNGDYWVNYTIDQSGKKHEYPQLIKGADMTENQINDYVNRVEIGDAFYQMAEDDAAMAFQPCPQCKERPIYFDKYGISYGLCMPCHTSKA